MSDEPGRIKALVVPNHVQVFLAKGARQVYTTIPSTTVRHVNASDPKQVINQQPRGSGRQHRDAIRTVAFRTEKR